MNTWVKFESNSFEFNSNGFAYEVGDRGGPKMLRFLVEHRNKMNKNMTRLESKT